MPFCKLFAGLGSSNKSAISLLLSDFCSVLSSTFPFASISLEDMEGTFFSPRVLSGYKGSLDTCFSQGTMQLMSWPDEEHYLCPLQSFVVSLLLSLVSTLLLSCTGGVLSHLNFLTHRFPQFPWRNLCSLIMLTVFSLESPSCSTCRHSSQDTSHPILHRPAMHSCAACSLVTLGYLWPLVQTLGSCPASGAPWFSIMLPFLQRGWVTTTSNQFVFGSA